MASTHSLRIVSFNRWFGEADFEARARGLFALLAELRPDVVALQEVTPELLPMIQADPWLRGLACSAATPEQVEPYGNLLLCSRPVASFERVRLWSYQGRHINLLRLVDGPVIGTVHLESRRHNGEIRGTQLSDLFAEFAGELSLLCGDFNFAPGADEEAAIPQPFTDAWPLRRGCDEGWTVDTEVNRTRALVSSGRVKQARIDRVYFHPERLALSDIEVIGKAPIDRAGEVWISDHFGLRADFTYKKGPG